ncbi:serine hydrolase [Garicola koreensis]|uniref:Beta-lactamase class A n=1 Tax=Garicola koreensis TaxID=1262554 RepID=A0A7W5TUJ0_9MICC|nr:serine hydrolase [Garicola koreensis]MBB3667544.1 beta-lactamase class A [Garicola koreensis]
MSADPDVLYRRVSQLAEQQPFAVHWQIRLPTACNAEPYDHGVVIGEGAQTQLASFSTRKVSLLAAALALVHRGELNLAQPLTVTAAMKDGVQAGIMKNLAPGVELSLEDHLRQMMITSDNICTQLVFDAIGQVTGDALQWVNDYCAWVGMRATVHREIFPRSAELSWHHGIEAMTVTTPADQAHLLALLGQGTYDDAAAARLHLSRQLCRFAVELMYGIYTPLLAGRTSSLRFAEKNGRGLRSLSQVGLATAEGAPVAAVAVYAENIPTQLPDGTPGRLAAHQLFADIGAAVEDWQVQPTRQSSGGHSSSGQSGDPGDLAGEAYSAGILLEAGTTRQLGEPSVLSHQQSHRQHRLAGVGKLFAALALAEQAEHDPTLLQASVTITGTHRRRAAVGPLRTHTGDLSLALGDAVGLIISTSDAAASLAVADALRGHDVDLVAQAQQLTERLGHGPDRLTATSITGAEPAEGACGDLLVGQTTPQDLARLLVQLACVGGLDSADGLACAGGLCSDASADPEAAAPESAASEARSIAPAAAERVLGWMSQVFEPAGLSSALPGYGPKRVPQWSVSGVELRSPSSVFSTGGWSSVMISYAARDQKALVVAATHHPSHAGGAAGAGRRVSRIFAGLGSAAYRGAGPL